MLYILGVILVDNEQIRIASTKMGRIAQKEESRDQKFLLINRLIFHNHT